MPIDLAKLRSEKKIIQLQGREYVTHQGLLFIAHEHGIESIRSDLISWCAETRAAVVKATASGERGTFDGLGDACPDNVGRNIAGATLRMAETRAVNRALRLYTGLGMTSAEELPGREPEAPRANPKRASGNDTGAGWLARVSALAGVEPSALASFLATYDKRVGALTEVELEKASAWILGAGRVRLEAFVGANS